MGRYGFLTRFEARAPLPVVRDAVARPQTWVGDAESFVTFTLLDDGDDVGQGARFDAAVRAPLGYRLAAVVVVDRVEPERVAMSLTGDLVGTADWTLDGDGTAPPRSSRSTSARSRPGWTGSSRSPARCSSAPTVS